MYLSRFRLNTQLGETRRLLASNERIHATVQNCFSRNSGRVLWRLDKLKGSYYLLIVSSGRPDFGKMLSKYGENQGDGKTIDYSSLLNNLKIGQSWRFRLVANPVHRSKDPAFISKRDSNGKERGEIHFFRKSNEQEDFENSSLDKYQKDWLLFRSEKNGFKIVGKSLIINGREKKKFRKFTAGEPKRKNTVTLSVATFEGVLEITDLKAFQNALKNGIGRAKAYGCGMLTIVGQ